MEYLKSVSSNERLHMIFDLCTVNWSYCIDLWVIFEKLEKNINKTKLISNVYFHEMCIRSGWKNFAFFPIFILFKYLDSKLYATVIENHILESFRLNLHRKTSFPQYILTEINTTIENLTNFYLLINFIYVYKDYSEIIST